MNKFIKNPNLPVNKVTSVLVDFRIDANSIKTLRNLGIYVYTTRKTEQLYDAVSAHPDMVIHHLGGDLFVASPENAGFYAQIDDLNVVTGKSGLELKYPGNIAYNAARVGNYLIHNFKYTDRVILEKTEHLTKIDVKQGYSND